MPTVTTVVVVVGAFLPAVVFCLFGITRVLPRDRDCEFEIRLLPPTVRFSITRNGGQSRC